MVHRCEIGIPRLRPRVSEDHEGVAVRVEILKADLIALDPGPERCRGLVRRVVATPAVVGILAHSVAIDVHVGEQAIRALNIYDAVVGQVVGAVSPFWKKRVSADFSIRIYLSFRDLIKYSDAVFVPSLLEGQL